MKILIMGLPGTGKSYLAERLSKELECAWYNADDMRSAAKDWDFSYDGRNRQAFRMDTIASFEKKHNRTVICDFVCPTEEAQKIFRADYIIWMKTLNKGRYEDTNYMFKTPKWFNKKIEHHMTQIEIESLANEIRKEL